MPESYYMDEQQEIEYQQWLVENKEDLRWNFMKLKKLIYHY